jgi:His/Glu/Gln/Arg/opine family amino acid ABC transporter permease subunit
MSIFEGFDFARVISMLLDGMWVTAQVTVLSLLIALVIGLISCLMGLSKNPILRGLSGFYLWLIRGTPFIVQLFIIYFGLPQLVKAIGIDGFRITAFAASIATLALNAGAYISEIFRGGIAAVDDGQMEAARSLGLSKSRAMIKVVLPQAFKISVPSLCNQFIITLKDSSLASCISLKEIVFQGRQYADATYQMFATYLMIGVAYLIIISVLSWCIKLIERRLDVGKG